MVDGYSDNSRDEASGAIAEDAEPFPVGCYLVSNGWMDETGAYVESYSPLSPARP